jgi:hypothetical protein
MDSAATHEPLQVVLQSSVEALTNMVKRMDDLITDRETEEKTDRTGVVQARKELFSLFYCDPDRLQQTFG